MNYKKAIAITAILLSFACIYLGRAFFSISGANPLPAASTAYTVTPTCNRIVSLAPSITEVLFALGLEEKIVGVTRYCKYPPEAQKKPRIGGYYDPNYEAIVALRADLVVLFPEHEEPKKNLQGLHINTLTVSHRSITDILDSITTIGSFCGVEPAAQRIVADLKRRTGRIKEKTEGLYRPRTIISVGRSMGKGGLDSVYISGRDGFYTELLSLAGGTNIYDKGTVAFPVFSGEGLIRLNPEVIIEMVPNLRKNEWDQKTILQEWTTSCEVDAVKHNRVYLFAQDYAVVPGPRFILLLENMARVLHPEIAWEQP